MPKAIMGGDAKDGLVVTVTMEKEKPGITPSEAQAKYGPPRSSAADGSVEFLDVKGMPVVIEQKAILSESGYHAYATKDDMSFDIHITADPARIPKQKVLDTLASFAIEPSTEMDEQVALQSTLQGSDPSRMGASLVEFSRKYPGNLGVFARRAPFCARQIDQTKHAARSLKNHKVQPLTDPRTLWLICDSIGMPWHAEEHRKQSRSLSGAMRSHQCGSKRLKAASAYNLAIGARPSPSCLKCAKSDRTRPFKEAEVQE
jgi:hypothetical protein